MIKQKNFSNQDPATLPADTEYVQCNFSHSQPDTGGAQPVGVRLWPGDDTPRTFTNCNLFNCEPPPGSTVINCNTAIVTAGELGPVDELEVDGVVVHTTQYHDRTFHGKYDAETESYDRTGAPSTTPEDY